ncbi:unnamed protein product [Phaedon cochleariae]|uniref:C2H2-type domain-containing protein n=1 Tax=Phaedon cochleariae TaxID=80249 RepID=A0A9N9X2Q0_PHACE|nr:unnamed protein product [Phaedon cochleariae]
MRHGSGILLRCPGCSKHYKTKNSLSVHQSRDCKYKSMFMCLECRRTFRRKENVRHHLFINKDCNKGGSALNFVRIKDPEMIKQTHMTPKVQ